MKIKLIVSDLDGTLVKDDYTVSEKNRQAVREAKELGVDTVIATGRMHRSALRYAEELAITAPIISYNGAVIRSAAGDTLSTSYISPNVVERVLCYVFSRDIYVQLYSGDDFYYVEKTPAAEEYERANKLSGTAVGRVGMLSHTENVPKLLVVINDASKTNSELEALRNAFRNEISVARSNPTYIEVVRPGVSKARAMMEIAKSKGVLPEEIMAIGDSGNDIEMIRSAGLGVAMGNAHETVKEAADEVTASCDEDGFAEAVRRYVLKDL